MQALAGNRSRAILVFVLCLFGAASASALSSRKQNPISNFLESSRVAYERDTERTASEDLEHALYVWAKQGAGLDELRSRAAKRFALSPALAAELVDLTFARAKFDSFSADDKAAAALAGRYRAVLAAHPENPVVYDEAVLSIAGLEHCDGKALDALVALRHDEVATRYKLFEQTNCLPLLTPLTAQQGNDPGIYLVLADARGKTDNAITQLALLRAGDDIASLPGSDIPLARRAALRVARLRAELEAGRGADAIAALPEDKEPLKASVIEALDVRDRLAIAAAFWLEQRPTDAIVWRDLAAAVPPSPDDESAQNVYWTPQSANGEHKRNPRPAYAWRGNLVHLLALALSPDSREDSFALLTMQYGSGSSLSQPDPYWSGIWSPLVNRLSLRDGYPGLVAPRDDEWMISDRAEEARKAIEECHRCSQRLLDAIHAVAIAPDAAEDVARLAERAVELPESVRVRMDRQIAVPLVRWREQPLPIGLRTPWQSGAQHPDDELRFIAAGKSSADKQPAWVERLPAGELVRYQQDGSRVVAITASQSLDPVGEISGGGYWISVSNDGGTTFDLPLYTGLRVFQPYVIRPTSKLPLIDGDELRIEVSVRRIDPEKIMFPPIGLPVVESRNDLFLSVPMAGLSRDSDGDGLTDITEYALLLDPEDADTDGDGNPDASDALPQVPRNVDADRHAESLAASLNQLMGKSIGAIITTSAHAGGEPAQGYSAGTGTDVHDANGATFVVAPAQYFGSIDLQQRVIVLSPSQAKAVAKTRGVFLPIRIIQFEVSRSGDQGVMVWSSGWAGGTFLLHKIDGKWKVEVTSSWIT